MVVFSPPYENQLHGGNHNTPSYQMVKDKGLPFEYTTARKDIVNIGNLKYGVVE